MLLGIALILTVLSLLHPVTAHAPLNQTTLTPSSFVYLPQALKAATPSPTSSPTATSQPGVDLVVWDIINSPEVPVLGQTIIITVSVKNQGGDDAGAATLLRLSVDGQKVPEDYLIPPVASGDLEHRAWGLGTSGLGTGLHSMKGDVDISDAVPETNELNNSLQDSFQVVSSAQ
jgi:subtilase family serine protease